MPCVHYLYVFLADKPRPMSQYLVDLIKIAEFGRDEFQAPQPLGISPHSQEL